jgi:hypothetical protein
MPIESVDESVEAIFTNAQMLLDHGLFIAAGRSVQIFHKIEAAQAVFVILLFHALSFTYKSQTPIPFSC